MKNRMKAALALLLALLVATSGFALAEAEPTETEGEFEEVFSEWKPDAPALIALREFSDPKEMRVIFAKSTEDYKEMTLEELLPESFGPDALEK